MIVNCAKGRVVCETDEQLEAVIRACAADGMDDIWMGAREGQEYPSLAVLVNRELACVHYFDGTEMVQSKGDMGADGTVSFCPGGEVSELPAYTAIPLDRAIAGAKEFAATGRRPACIEWNEL